MEIAKFVGVDEWSRYVFKCKETGRYYCFVNVLADNQPLTQERIVEILKNEKPHYKGLDFDGEPEFPIENIILIS